MEGAGAAFVVTALILCGFTVRLRRCRARSCIPPDMEARVKLRFYGKGGSEQDECPAVFVDEETLKLVFVGIPIDDPDVIAEIEKHSRIYATEQAFEIPKELRKPIWEALGGHNPNFG